jgi:hypothetical protein
MAVLGTKERTMVIDHWQFFVEVRSSKGRGVGRDGGL